MLQMLENWAWQPRTLQLMSGHWQRPSEVLPLDLAEKLVRSRQVRLGERTVPCDTVASFYIYAILYDA
jgi:Zn-dependent oligopeptidase